MSKPKLNQPDVETTTTVGGYSTTLSEYYQQMANKPNAISKYAQITNQDLMSKTIEFVGENIKDIKISIEGYKRLKTYYLSQENYEDCVIMSLEQNIKYLENKLFVWEQIKAELEAWEVVADKIFYGEGRCLIDSSVWFGEEAETIKKAMEVKNDNSKSTTR